MNWTRTHTHRHKVCNEIQALGHICAWVTNSVWSTGRKFIKPLVKSVQSGNTGFTSLWFDSFFIFVPLQSIVYATSIMPFSTLQRVLIIEFYFRTQINRLMRYTFLMVLYEISQSFFGLVNLFADFLRIRWSEFRNVCNGVCDTFNRCCDYVIITLIYYNYNLKCLISMIFNFGLRDFWGTTLH